MIDLEKIIYGNLESFGKSDELINRKPTITALVPPVLPWIDTETLCDSVLSKAGLAA
ncbi:MAG: hypothetical protein RIE23_07725 [Pontimonas sp.]